MFGSDRQPLDLLRRRAEWPRQHGGTGYPDPTPAPMPTRRPCPQQIAAEAPSRAAHYNAKLAEALYSYGMYPEAEAAAQLAITKGGTHRSHPKRPMVLGQALVAQGKYDDAIAAFGKVTGGGPATPRIARLWVDYAKVKKNPPAPGHAGAAPRNKRIRGGARRKACPAFFFRRSRAKP